MKITKTPTAVTPRYTDVVSPGMDLYVDTEKEYTLQPGETYLLPTGIKVDIPRNCFGVIYPKSGLHKKGLVLANGVDLITAGQKSEIILAVKNVFSDVVRINGRWGLRAPLAQLVIQPYRFEKVEVTDNTETTDYTYDRPTSVVDIYDRNLKWIGDTNALKEGQINGETT